MKSLTFRGRAGQNTVEYLLILAVIVGVVLVTGMALKKYMPTLFEQVSVQITDATRRLGGSSGNGD